MSIKNLDRAVKLAELGKELYNVEDLESLLEANGYSDNAIDEVMHVNMAVVKDVPRLVVDFNYLADGAVLGGTLYVYADKDKFIADF